MHLQNSLSKSSCAPSGSWRGAFGTAPPQPRAAHRPQQCKATSKTVEMQQSSEHLLADRRDVLLRLSSLTAAVVSGLQGSPGGVLPAGAVAQPQVPEVGTYLPPAGIDDLVLFQPDARKTPALRAGTVDPTSPYKVRHSRDASVAWWLCMSCVSQGVCIPQQQTQAPCLIPYQTICLTRCPPCFAVSSLPCHQASGGSSVVVLGEPPCVSCGVQGTSATSNTIKVVQLTSTPAGNKTSRDLHCKCFATHIPAHTQPTMLPPLCCSVIVLLLCREGKVANILSGVSV